MLRRLLLYLSTAGWMRAMMSHFFVARRVALRFVAGETLESAILTAKALKERGILVTMDYLGESVEKVEDTQQVTAMYCKMLEAIHQNELEASISLKLTHLGLNIGEDLCVTNLRAILTKAKKHHIPVTIDMENTPYTDITLRIYRTMRDEYGFDNVGTVIQSYLYRSEEDMRQLAAENAHVRLCKGAYLESPEVAFPEKADVDANYVKLMEQYLGAGTDAYLCIATHDEKMIQAAEQIIRQHNIPPERYEFQMLYGIRSQRQAELAKAHKMRVYVPFGEAWYPYFMRRLAERPANLWFFARALVKR
jgi:proline dehydrogenase